MLNLRAFGKSLPINNKNFLSMLYGVLNHAIFRPLFSLRLRSSFSVSGWNLILWLNPPLERALLNISLELLKTNYLYVGKYFIMLGEWLQFTLMYNELLQGLLYGSYLPVDRFSVKSKKLTTLRFVSLAVLRLNLFFNNLINRHLCTSRFFLFHISHLIYAEYKDQVLHKFLIHPRCS